MLSGQFELSTFWQMPEIIYKKCKCDSKTRIVLRILGSGGKRSRSCKVVKLKSSKEYEPCLCRDRYRKFRYRNQSNNKWQSAGHVPLTECNIRSKDGWSFFDNTRKKGSCGPLQIPVMSRHGQFFPFFTCRFGQSVNMR